MYCYDNAIECNDMECDSSDGETIKDHQMIEVTLSGLHRTSTMRDVIVYSYYCVYTNCYFYCTSRTTYFSIGAL